MPFQLSQFTARRTHLFHTTTDLNIVSLRQTRTLLPAATILARAGRASEARQHRATLAHVRLPSGVVSLMDQLPLQVGRMRLTGGWQFEDLLEALNERVFFWPGKIGGPIKPGVKHFARYVGLGVAPAILRIPTVDHVAVNGPPEFARYNTGAPRHSGGTASPRGPGLFGPCATAAFGISDVVEVVYARGTKLPDSTMVASSLAGPWRPL